MPPRASNPHIGDVLPDEQATPEQIAIFKAMTPQQRWHSALNEAGINYLVSGSMAAMLYGEPRVTHDVDLIVFLRADHLPQFPRIYPNSEFYLPPPEVIATEMARERRGHFNVIHHQSGLKAEFYLARRDGCTFAFKQ